MKACLAAGSCYWDTDCFHKEVLTLAGVLTRASGGHGGRGQRINKPPANHYAKLYEDVSMFLFLGRQPRELNNVQQKFMNLPQKFKE